MRKFDCYKKLLWVLYGNFAVIRNLWDRYTKIWLLYEPVMRSLKEISLLYDIVIRPFYGNLTVLWNCYETIIWKFHCYMKLWLDRYTEIWLLYDTVIRPFQGNLTVIWNLWERYKEIWLLYETVMRLL